MLARKQAPFSSPFPAPLLHKSRDAFMSIPGLEKTSEIS